MIFWDAGISRLNGFLTRPKNKDKNDSDHGHVPGPHHRIETAAQRSDGQQDETMHAGRAEKRWLPEASGEEPNSGAAFDHWGEERQMAEEWLDDRQEGAEE